MKQREIYVSDIERHIEGVIKADSNEFIVQEVKEYVVTRELEKHLSHFFEEYCKKNFSDSVWISGFFGSGKSHLLKILTYILENKTIDGFSCNSHFKEKIKDDFELQSNIDKASKIPTETLLFNIDQKAASITTKKETDAILSVFLRVFNEHLGYFGGDYFIAEIERNLDEQGLFNKFKEEILKASGDSWENIRDGIYFRSDDFGKAYSKVKNLTIEESMKVLDKQVDFILSIEDFVNRVVKYINKKPQDFRLIFCVDEIGQYIAENTKLMLNLQTLAETLQTKTNGRSFLIVTSQNDISSFIKDLKNSQSNDFSKIQARLNLKIDLKSSDVDEVIQKRLLAKAVDGTRELSSIYQTEKNNLKTLFRFTDDSRKFKEFNSDTSFINNYPFVPYQFDLFQSTLRGLSEHNVFQGKHQSVGERSMLGVFQAVAKKLVDKEVGYFVDYSSIFDGIRQTLKSEVQTSIIQAEKNIEDPLAISILKALFLVKYVKEFKANLQNITVLMQNSCNNEIGAFRNSIQTALNKLETQTYIQRIGDVYEYLTNDEKDVENEIKATAIDERDISKFLSEILFEEILKDSKVKLDSSYQPYEFGKKIDDHLIGKEKDFYVHFITPLNPNEITKANISMQSMGKLDLIIYLPDNDRLVEELRMHKKTSKYISLKTSSNLKPEVKKILSEKGELNQERRNNLKIDITEILKNAPMYLNGTEITDISKKEPVPKIKLAVQKLIYHTYPSLKLLVSEFKEEDIKRILTSSDDVLINTPLVEVETEVLNFLNRKKMSSERVTVKSIIDDFTARPYGWYATATICIVCNLFKKSKISIKKDSNNLDEKQIILFINNRNEQSNLMIEIEEDLSSSEIKKLKDFHNDFFNESNSGLDAKEISRIFKDKLRKELEDLQRIQALRSQLSFVSNLDDSVTKIKTLLTKDYPYFYKSINTFNDDLLDAKEQVIDPIKRFFNSQQKEIYDTIKKFYEANVGNISFLQEEYQKQISEFLANSKPYLNNIVQQSKLAFDNIKVLMSNLINEETQKATTTISFLMNNAVNSPDYLKLAEDVKIKVMEPFEQYIAKFQNENLIGNVRDLVNNIQTNFYPKQLQHISELAHKKEEPPVQPKDDDSDKQDEPKPKTEPMPVQPKVEYVSIKSVEFKSKKTVIENEADVNDYVETLKSTLISLIKDNKKITL
jgi:hypothetical protein